MVPTLQDVPHPLLDEGGDGGPEGPRNCNRLVEQAAGAEYLGTAWAVIEDQVGGLLLAGKTGIEAAGDGVFVDRRPGLIA